ncbi:hypothetical protein [Spongiimicrobium salis]|uniref:hypothetical protein n=1 Tax=Spongiimicrobium salis TaxID=1667022 RepID=UPI00374DE09B
MTILLILLLGPALMLIITGMVVWREQKKKLAKLLFIIAGIYLIIGLGTCGLLLSNI